MTAFLTKKPSDTLQSSDDAVPRRLRVLVFTTVFPNDRRPLHGTFVFERIRHLAALAEIQVVAPIPWFRAFRKLPPKTQAGDILAVYHPRFWYLPKVLKSFRGLFLFLSTVRFVSRLRKSFDFDLIDAHFAYPDGFAAVLLGRWFRRPVCITLRGTIVQWSKGLIGRRLCDWAIVNAKRVITVSENLAARARQGGVPGLRLEIIANGVDTKRFKVVNRAVARQALGLEGNDRLVVSVGHISPRKGFHRVIRSMPRILDSCPNVRFAIVGGKGAEQDNSAALRAQTEELGLTEHVLFPGAQPPDKVALWLGAADVFVLASDFEGCPNVVLEAMACGRPVVATKVGDIARMVPSFGGVLFQDPEDEVALADSIIEALAVKWNAVRIRDHVAKETWDGVAQQVAAQWHLAVAPSSGEEAEC